MDSIKINLGQNSYDILIGESLIDKAEKYIPEGIKRGSKIFIITDENVADIYLEKLEESLKQSFNTKSIILKAGEATKKLGVLEDVLNNVFENRPERGSTIIALGGGVIGDLSGFAASILLRGINFIQIPTSLLAMVDSSVGGKTGINNKFGKNLIGAFYQPKVVISDLEVLKTLPERELQAGYAEIVKYGLIDDVEFFENLEGKTGYEDIAYMVKKSCEAKARIVSEDEKEQGKRALLNLGHTFGHTLETICGYDGRLLHGEAVAIGMIQAFRFSEHIGICEKGCADRIEELFVKYGMRTKISDINSESEGKITPDRILDLMYQDKKVSSGKLVLILAEDIGKSFIKKDVNPNDLLEFLKIDVYR